MKLILALTFIFSILTDFTSAAEIELQNGKSFEMTSTCNSADLHHESEQEHDKEDHEHHCHCHTGHSHIAVTYVVVHSMSPLIRQKKSKDPVN